MLQLLLQFLVLTVLTLVQEVPLPVQEEEGGSLGQALEEELMSVKAQLRKEKEEKADLITQKVRFGKWLEMD